MKFVQNKLAEAAGNLNMFLLQWEAFKARKPKLGEKDVDDEEELARAEETIGDYKLKTSADYKVPKHLRESKVKKYKQLLHCREQVLFLLVFYLPCD